jgi:hypothetical protein
VPVAVLDPFHIHRAADRLEAILEPGALVSDIGGELVQERIQPEQHAHQQSAGVRVPQVRGVDGCLNHQALRLDEDVPLLAVDLLVTT